MTTTKTRRALPRGLCYLCGGSFAKNTLGRHLEKCRENQAAETSAGGRKPTSRTLFHLVVEGRDAPNYFLHLDVRGDATLANLDQFLRDAWLECCGHLSAFTIGDTRYMWEPPGGGFDDLISDEDESLDVPLADVLRPGLTFAHEYDFGTTTELKLRVLGEREEPVPARTPKVRVLARNEPPEVPCDKCGKPATQICAECVYEGEGFLCPAHARKHPCGPDMLLPLVNSPRAGMCGYTGPEGKDPAAPPPQLAPRGSAAS